MLFNLFLANKMLSVWHIISIVLHFEVIIWFKSSKCYLTKHTMFYFWSLCDNVFKIPISCWREFFRMLYNISVLFAFVANIVTSIFRLSRMIWMMWRCREWKKLEKHTLLLLPWQKKSKTKNLWPLQPAQGCIFSHLSSETVGGKASWGSSNVGISQAPLKFSLYILHLLT